MKKVFTIGVFDILHIGHVMRFQKAKSYRDHLTVTIQKDDYIGMFKQCPKIVYDLK